MTQMNMKRTIVPIRKKSYLSSIFFSYNENTINDEQVAMKINSPNIYTMPEKHIGS